jgi:hypothetical protein
MTRRLFNLLTALSLLLCVAAVALWVRSYWVADQVRRGRMQSPTTIVWWQVYSDGGAFGAGRTMLTFGGGMSSDMIADWSRGVRIQWNQSDPSARLSSNLIAEWFEGSFTDTRRVDDVYLQIPYWMAIAATVAIPGARFARAARRQRRQKANYCPSCGYDLRASPGRCPECGGGRAGV